MESVPTPRTRAGSSWSVLLLVSSVLVSLLIGEVVLRLFEPKPMRVHHRGFYEHDAVLGWKMKANATRVNHTDEFRATESTNSRGIRGPEYSYGKRPNEYRLLVLGDSFAEGYTVNFEELFSEVLKTLLNTGSDHTYYEVVNAGTVGYGTDQELLFYQHEGYKYHADLVILMCYENDVVDNVTRREIYGKFKPLFRIEDDELVITKGTAPRDSMPDQSGIAPERSDLHKWLAKRSRVYSLVSAGLARPGLSSEQTQTRQSVPDDFRVLSTVPDADIENAWKLTEMLLVELKKRVQDSRASLLVYYVPSIHSVDRELWEATRKKYGMTGNHWDACEVESRLRRICAQNSIDFIPTIGQFKEKARSLGKSANCFYYPSDAHWNIQGHRFVGEILADYIRRRLAQERASHRWSDSREAMDLQDPKK